MDSGEQLKQFAGAIVRLDARCDALEMALLAVGERAGIEPQKLLKLISVAQERRHQTMLEAAEDISPSLGAALDCREPLPPLNGLE